ncbi:DUF6927 domain-containing protein [Streptomyces sp. NPDC015220]|uniref:DUF6927 domain-containing protein n=1 Tax=Streptomyces sp. NPDC015220 TaxID=3364947 RepID=UPI0036F68C08
MRQRTDPDFNFGYKDLDENCGPGDHKAPKSVLNALTPTTNEYALAWRTQCRAHHAQRDFLRSSLKPGYRSASPTHWTSPTAPAATPSPTPAATGPPASWSSAEAVAAFRTGVTASLPSSP